jgi:hypothetical protein
MQKATLDPSKISGYCGRLKCCLRYEDKTYSELKKRLPRKNTRVKTKYGQGKVLDSQILTQLVMVEKDNAEKIVVPVEELEIIADSQGGADNSKENANNGDNNKSRPNQTNRKRPSQKG